MNNPMAQDTVIISAVGAPATHSTDLVSADAVPAATSIQARNTISTTTVAQLASDTVLLPAAYEAAQKALAECERMDECQEWADKAKALASYAKQAGDETLHRHADRIKARAVRRIGELLKEVPAAQGANQNIGDGAGIKVGRKAAAKNAGISTRQKVTALQVATVPREEFERQVESEKPPTITALARLGTVHGKHRTKIRKKTKLNPSHLVRLNKPWASDPIQEVDAADDTKEKRWQRSCGNLLGDILSMRAYWAREFGEWEAFERPSHLITLAKDAAAAWKELASFLTRK